MLGEEGDLGFAAEVASLNLVPPRDGRRLAHVVVVAVLRLQRAVELPLLTLEVLVAVEGENPVVLRVRVDAGDYDGGERDDEVNQFG